MDPFKKFYKTDPQGNHLNFLNECQFWLEMLLEQKIKLQLNFAPVQQWQQKQKQKLQQQV